MSFETPALLLLLVPALWVAWRTRDGAWTVDGLRLLTLVLLALALAGPVWRAGATGRDLVILVDRSRSMPEGAAARALELVRLAEDARRAGDRVGVVSFGSRPHLERFPAAEGRFAGFERELDADGSNLARALEFALQLVPEGRPASLFVISDGEADGADVLSVARRAAARGVRIDVRPVQREGRGDLAALRLDLPAQVGALEPFQFSAWVRSDERVEASYRLTREGRELAAGRRVFEPGLNRMVFRDVLERAGAARYELRLEGAADRVPENDRALGVVGVEGPRPILVLNDGGTATPLVGALRGAGLALLVARPEDVALDPLGLKGFRAVVLEDVEAARLGPGLVALRTFVLQRGGGLLMTGGPASFGRGGYYRSALEEVLPVSLELRQESRKQSVALSIALDRSGSMAMPAGLGATKMDLANQGTAAAIELLTPADSISILAIDTAVHVVQAQTAVVDRDALAKKALGIRSSGGGIFVRTALLAAARELADATQMTRHIVLFADAADAEEQEGCAELVAELRSAGVSLSVIALGGPQDPDADFLIGLASQGGGQIYFSTDAGELPRLFAQDTLVVSRATFVDQPTLARVLPDLLGLGDLAPRAFPTIGGYNRTYLRPGAVLGAVTDDGEDAPLLAFHPRGLGRAAVYTGQVGGRYGAELPGWSGFAPLFATLGRWLVGQEEPEALFADVRREGREALITVEVDPDAPTPPDTSRLAALVTLPDGRTRELALERVAAERFEARFPLEREGVVLGAVRVGEGRSLRLAPLTLPYSPEFEPGADPRRGERLLARVAKESGGAVAPPADALLRGPRRGHAPRSFVWVCALSALLLWLIEIATRRLGLALRPPRVLGRAVERAFAGVRRRPRPTATAPTPRGAAAPTDVEAPPADTPPAVPGGEPAPTLAEALARARRSAGRELGR